MAQVVKLKKGQEFTFKAPSKGGGEAKYPWDEWLDGQLWYIERSEGPENEKGTIEEPTTKKDFEVLVDAMPAKLKTAGRRRYKIVQISRVGASGELLKEALIFKARDMTDEERVKEDVLRASEKEAFKARKAKKAAETSANGTGAGANTNTAAPTEAVA